MTVPRVFLIGAVFAMSKNALLGRVYSTRTLIGRLYRPHVALSGYALSSIRNGIREEDSDAGSYAWRSGRLD